MLPLIDARTRANSTRLRRRTLPRHGTSRSAYGRAATADLGVYSERVSGRPHLPPPGLQIQTILVRRTALSASFYPGTHILGVEMGWLADASRWMNRTRSLKVEVHPPYTLHACVSDLERAGVNCPVNDDRFGCVLAAHHRDCRADVAHGTK